VFGDIQPNKKLGLTTLDSKANKVVTIGDDPY